MRLACTSKGSLSVIHFNDALDTYLEMTAVVLSPGDDHDLVDQDVGVVLALPRHQSPEHLQMELLKQQLQNLSILPLPDLCR